MDQRLVSWSHFPMEVEIDDAPVLHLVHELQLEDLEVRGISKLGGRL